MPSGSHGGHSHSGGVRIGGSRSSHSSSRGGFHYHGGPWRFHFWGHHYIVPTRYSGIMSLFAVVMVFAIFFIFAGCLMLADGQSDMDKAKRDYDRYQAMIAYARENPELLVTGTIENHYYDDEAEKWYLTYTFPTNDGGSVEGESYPVYTWADLQQAIYRVGAKIELALDRVPENEYDDVDSVPTDYADMPLERDGFYANAKNSKQAGQIMLTVAAIAFGASLVLNILIFATTKKREEATSTVGQATATGNAPTNNTATNPTPSANSERKSMYCAYCGTLLETSDKKCPSCGAKVK